MFKYCISDFNGAPNNPTDQSEFDRSLISKWKMLHDMPGIFRYDLRIRNEKVVEGKYGFILQLNPERSTKRRTPDSVKHVNQEFDPQSFNFNQISPMEYIMEMKQDDTKDMNRNLVIINSSPINFGHSLVCPSIEDNLPQIITWKSLVLMMHILFLTNNRYLRVGFNSLCAMASVNHLHFHIIMLDYQLPTETVECTHLAGPVYTTHKDYPAKGFCFQLKSTSEIAKVADDIFKLTSYLTESNVAHNVYAMRGLPVDGSSLGTIWRIFIWARKSCQGAKQVDSINAAICEFSGHFPVRSMCKVQAQEEFAMTEGELCALLADATSETFYGIVDDVAQLFAQ